ncbi:peptidoglycan-binding protein [Devosia albogilva]|uniref:Peptidoglycan-binding protein n=1 Tax=Devosia albogilva TaxID=429726 RepID=A0ABW5QLE8_9HYPH
MPRAYLDPETLNVPRDPSGGEWQALRGELVALLDQVEDRYARDERPEPAVNGLAQRVRTLRERVEGGAEPAVRRREALRTVKRAVDRFSERDTMADDETDALTRAIAEIRSRQMSAPGPSVGRRASENPEFRELTTLVTGLSGRLERLEGELKAQRNGHGSVREVASQVEQLTHVVELLAGAVGETGQVKRLEAQIAALGAMIEEGPRVDLSAINHRLDDVTATVGKLAELQAQQMEREVVREERRIESGGDTAPLVESIEQSVRNIYDRIDAIERNVALPSPELERLTAEMAAFTKAMKSSDAAPSKLVAKVDALAARIGDFESANGDVAGLKTDVSALRDAVLAGMEPRFQQIENRLEDLASRNLQPADTRKVEDQLHQLMARMDDTGAQLDKLARLYSTQQDQAGLEAMATLVAERTSEAVTRKAPAPVAMFGPESLKSIEDQITGLIRTASKGPDYDKLATMLAQKTSEAISKTAAPAAAPGLSEDSISALEERMTAVLNTAGRDTAERLARLEAALSGNTQRQPARQSAPEASPAEPQSTPADTEDKRLDAMLAALARSGKSDSMPANPAAEAPLVDPGFPPPPPSRVEAEGRPVFDPAVVERPPRPVSSFGNEPTDPFAEVQPKSRPAAPDVAPAASSTSTFVAAARRAQQARQDGPANDISDASPIGRALARFRPKARQGDAEVAVPTAGPVKVPAKSRAAKPAKQGKPAKPAKGEQPAAEPRPSRKAAAAAVAPIPMVEDDPAAEGSFLSRNRRPLLLAAALVAVSMLALNLVLQRSAEQQATPTVAPSETTAPADPVPADPVATPVPSEQQDVSLVPPNPRTIDMVDSSAVGAINPNATAGFSAPKPTATPMPPALLATTAASAPAEPAADPVPTGIPSSETTGSIPDTIAAAPAEPFDLPPEAVGPIELRQAAADGDVRAQFEIGAIFSEGRAVEQDFAEAAKWYERAAAQGFAPAQYRLGNLYEAGQGLEKDLEVARLWYQRSAEDGNRMAMHNLAALHAGGELGPQDFETAAEWFTKAAELGMTDSQFNLGMLYARGLGVEQDFEQSYKWFSLAARSGDADAGKAKDDIAKSLNAEAVGRLDAELASWKAAPIDLPSNFAPIGTWAEAFDPGEPITSREVITRVQQALVKLGYDIGTPDGVAGPKTAEAIKAFERGTGMSEKGQINPRLLAVLGSQPV